MVLVLSTHVFLHQQDPFTSWSRWRRQAWRDPGGGGKEHQALADGAHISSENLSSEWEVIPAMESRVSHIH